MQSFLGFFLLPVALALLLVPRYIVFYALVHLTPTFLSFLAPCLVLFVLGTSSFLFLLADIRADPVVNVGFVYDNGPKLVSQTECLF